MTIEREELISITQLIDDLERSDMVFITFGEESDMHDWEKDLIIQALKDKSKSSSDCPRVDGVTNEDIQKALDIFYSFKFERGSQDERKQITKALTLAVDALKAYRPSGQSNQDTADEGIPVVRKKRTSEPVDNPDKLPNDVSCEVCSNRTTEHFRCSVLLDIPLTAPGVRFVGVNYCPNCGRELRTSLSLAEGER